jgi:alpha-glucosidase
VSLEAPLERILLLVKAGSMIPMEEGKQLILHIYPPVEGSSEAILYSDANDGYGESRLDKFRMVCSENNLEITWEEHGEYPFPYTGVQLHLHGMKLQQAWVDDAEVACQEQIMECDRPLSGRFAPSRLARLPMPTARLRRTGASRKPGGTAPEDSAGTPCDRPEGVGALRHRFHKLRIQSEFADILP